MSKRCNLCSFQKLKKYFWLPFLIPIICFTSKFFSEEMKTNGGEKDIEDVTEENTHTFVFLYQIIQTICLILGGLLHFLSVHKSKTRKESLDSINNDSHSSSENSSEKSFLSKNTIKKKKADSKKNIIIIFMPLLLILYNLGIAHGVKHPQLEKRVYFLLFITLINMFIFKKQLYKHHKLALIITFIGVIPIYISFFLYLDNDKYSILYDILLLVGSFCYSVYLVLIKYLTLNKQMFVLLLLLKQGILSFIYTLFIFITISLIKNRDLSYISNIFYCGDINYICISFYKLKITMYIILNTILQTLIFSVVNIFSPELFAISDIFSPLFSFIASCFQTNKRKGLEIFLTVLGYLIMAFGAFIYNELIVCNFCRFNENTWKAIDKKAYDDISGKNERDSGTYVENFKIEHLDSLNDEPCFEMKNNN